MSASFVDPYLAILRDDSSLLLLQIDDSGDLDEITLPGEIPTSKWRSVCLYHDKYETFSAFPATPDRPVEDNTFMFLLSSECKLSVS